jgi:hypothetical protein
MKALRPVLFEEHGLDRAQVSLSGPLTDPACADDDGRAPSHEQVRGRRAVRGEGDQTLAMKALRPVLFEEHGLDRAQVSLSGYWARGRDEDAVRAASTRAGKPAGASARWIQRRLQPEGTWKSRWKALRPVLFEEHGLDRAQVSLSGYWARGRDEDALRTPGSACVATAAADRPRLRRRRRPRTLA